VAVIFWLKATPISALIGVVEVTVGGVMITAAPVLKFHT